MGNDEPFSKTFQLTRSLVLEFESVRSLLNGSKDIPENNLELQTLVVNKSIEYAFQNNPVLRELNDLISMKRSNGTKKVTVHISRDNWFKLVELLMRADEGDLIQLCLRRYMDEVKMKRSLP